MAKQDCEPRSEPIRAFCEVELAATLMSPRGRPVVIQSFESDTVVKVDITDGTCLVMVTQ